MQCYSQTFFKRFPNRPSGDGVMARFRPNGFELRSFAKSPFVASGAHLGTCTVSSGLEPMGYFGQFVQTSGAAPQAAVVIELGMHFYTFQTMVCVDGLDPGQLASVEHICRRILQLQKAIKRSPRSPDFTSLAPYMMHSAGHSGVIQAPNFEKYVADLDKANAQFLKQNRLAAEERDADNKRKGGRNKKKDEDG